jgi:hypothetical protein
VDPPIAWLQLRRGQLTEVGIRIQLTCYLSSRRAQPVLVRETRLLLALGARQVPVPWLRVTDVDGGSFPEPVGHTITGHETEHALIEYGTDDPEVVAVLRKPGESISVVVEALVNTSEIQRKVAEFDLIRPGSLSIDGEWTQVGTGR